MLCMIGKERSAEKDLNVVDTYMDVDGAGVGSTKATMTSRELLVSNNGQDYARTQLFFRHESIPMTIKVTPRSGPTQGGTELWL